MDSQFHHDWEKALTTVSQLWKEAYNIGADARLNGLPPICNLKDKFCHKDTILKVYKSAWEQGYGLTVGWCDN